MALNIIAVLFRLIFITALGFVFALKLRPDIELYQLSVALLSVSVFVFAIVAPEVSLVVSGLLIPLMPVFGEGALALSITSQLLGFEARKFKASNTTESGGDNLYFNLFKCFSVLWILPQLLSFIHTLIIELDLLIIKSIYDAGGFSGLYWYFAVNVISWEEALFQLSITLLTVIFMFHVVEEVLKNRQVHIEPVRLILAGISCGAIVSAVYGIGQILELHGLFSVNRNPFWISVERYNATLTDPNALGIFAGLLAPALLILGSRLRTIIFLLGGVALLLIGLYSASRSFVLCLILWGLFFTWELISRRGSSTRKVCRILFLLLILGIPLLVAVPSVNKTIKQFSDLPIVHRVIETASLDTGKEMLKSRSIFWKLSFAGFEKSPVIGVGAGRFYQIQSALAEDLGIDLKGWRDNSNNYYLQILSEQGILGFLFLILRYWIIIIIFYYSGKEILSKKDADSSSEPYFKIAGWYFIILALVLITGPHLHFVEVLMCSAIFLALPSAVLTQTSSSVFQRKAKWFYIVAGLLFVLNLGFLFGLDYKKSIRGVYPPEKFGSKVTYWTAGEAILRFCGEADVNIPFKFRLNHPQLGSKPVTVTIDVLKDAGIGSSSLVLNTLKINNHEWKTIQLPMAFEKTNKEINLRIRVSHLWSPRVRKQSNDSRYLGIYFEEPGNLCSN